MTCICGQSIVQPAKGRKRRYCSEGCRRAADNERKAAKYTTVKPSNCDLCHRPIIQPKTGRPRTTCAACRPSQKPAQNVLGVL